MLKYKKILALVLLGIMVTNFAVAAIPPGAPNVGDTSGLGNTISSGIAAIGKTAAELAFAASSFGIIYFINGGLFMIAKFLGAILFVAQALAQTALTMADIGNNPVVNQGWALSRDVANMFFILILLIIAFGTILRIEGWGYEKLLPKLIVTAFLINFSKVITLALIDASQILTLFFINLNPNFTAALADAFNVNKFSDFALTFALAPMTTYYGFLVEIVFKLLTILAYGVLAFLFLVRVVTFWFLIVLAPFVWLLGILPKFQQYASMWWSKLIKWLVFAPVASFLIYLSVITMRGTQAALFATANILNPVDPSLAGEISSFFPAIMQPKNFLSAILAFMFLFGSMMVAQMTGNAATKVFFDGANGVRGLVKSKAFWKPIGQKLFTKEAPSGKPAGARLPLSQPTSPGPKPDQPPAEAPRIIAPPMAQFEIDRERAAETAAREKTAEAKQESSTSGRVMRSATLENLRNRAKTMKEQAGEKWEKFKKAHPDISENAETVVGDIFAPLVKTSLAGTGLFKKKETKKEKGRRLYEESIIEENKAKEREKEQETEEKGETK